MLPQQGRPHTSEHAQQVQGQAEAFSLRLAEFLRVKQAPSRSLPMHAWWLSVPSSKTQKPVWYCVET